MLRRRRGRQGRIRLARRKFVERIEKWSKLPIDETLRLYDRGKYRGTLIEVEISIFRNLYDGYEEDGTERG